MYRRTLLLLLVPAAVAGCGKPEFEFVPVEGAVTHAGQPVPHVVVEFLADSESGTRGPRAWAVTGADGKYRLATDTGVDGAVVGHHRVVIRPVPPAAFAQEAALRGGGQEKQAPLAPTPPAPGSKRGPVITPNYGEFWKTPLRADVKAGGEPVNIELP